MAVTSTWTVVRDILSADMSLTADEVIAKAKAKGVKAPDDAIRTTVHTLRKRLKKKAAALSALGTTTAPPPKGASKPAGATTKTAPTPAAKTTPALKPPAAATPAPTAKPAVTKTSTPTPKSAPDAARQTPAPSTSAVLRSILVADLALPADAVLTRAKAKGVTVPDAKLRAQIHNLKSELKRQAAENLGAPSPAPSPKLPAPKSTVPMPVAPAPTTSPTAVGVSGILANVTLVHAAVAACGGAEPARRVAEAVRACGGAEAFGTYLELVAGIRTPASAAAS